MSIFIGDNKVAGVGNPGRTGKPGESAYEIAKKYGYEGTEEEFALELSNAATKPDWLEEDENSPAFIRNKPEKFNSVIDWNQNDPDGEGYVQNRTHYDGRYTVKTEDVTINGTVGPYSMMKIANIPLDFDFSKIVAFTLVSNNGVKLIDEPVKVENYEGCLVAGPFALIDSYDYIGNIIPPGFSDLGLYVNAPYDGGDNVSFYYNFTLESGELVQLDPKYIKDMYEDNSGEKIIISENIVNNLESSTMRFKGNYSIKEKGEYKISLNGNEYTRTAERIDLYDDYSIIYMGNLYLYDERFEDNGDPFFIYEASDNPLWYRLRCNEEAEYIISMSGFTNDIKQLDMKYNPMLKKEFKTVFSGMAERWIDYPADLTSPIFGDAYITFDGIERKVTFIEDGYGGSITEEEEYTIWTYLSGEKAFVRFYWNDGDIHTLEIKCEDYSLKNSFTPNWDQNNPNGNGFIKNRTHYDSKQILTLENNISNALVGSQGMIKIADTIDFDIKAVKLLTLMVNDGEGLYVKNAPVIPFYEYSGYNLILPDYDNMWAAVYLETDEDADYWFDGDPHDGAGLYIYSDADDGSNVNIYYNFIYENREIKQLENKYLSMIDYREEEIFNETVQSGSEYPLNVNQYLIGDYTVVCDGIEEIVTFIKDGGYSYVNGQNYSIETWKDNDQCYLWIRADIDGDFSLIIKERKPFIKEEYLSGGGGGGDWSQNDPNGAGYIKNRTHYDKTGERALVIDEQGNMKEFLLAGEEYVFTMDGVEYYTTCLINMYSQPHVEFIIDKDNEYYITIQGRINNNSPVYNFYSNIEFTSGKLERIIKEIKTIDAKYINIDWNGNNSPIKNRTHYSSYDYEKIEAVFDGELYDQYGYGSIEFSSLGIPFGNIEMGFTYLISLNGKEYICKAHQFPMDYRGPHLGNSGINHNYWSIPIEQRQYFNTGEPFLIAYDWGDLSLFVENSYTGATYNLKVYKLKEKEKIHYLDSKYIKDMYGEFNNTTLVLPETHLIAMNESDYRQEGDWIYIGDSFFYLEPSTAKTYMVKLNGVWYDNCTVNQYGVLRDSSGQELFPINYYEGYAFIKNGYSCTLEVREKHNPSIKKISHKYIPTDAFILKDQVTGYENIIELHNGELKISCKSNYLEITSMPTKTQYMQGEKVDLSGLEIYAICQNGSRRIVTDYSYPEYIDTSMINNIEIKYTECDTEYIVLIPVTITPFETSLLNDFDYNLNENGTYNLTAWKGTYNGESSTKIIIPDNALLEV